MNSSKQKNKLLQPYTSAWIKDFEQLKLAIGNGLDGLACTIEHVGSTAVPNLDAKPIIDIDIVHTNRSGFATIKSRLEQIGYYHNGNQGIEDREVFKRNTGCAHGILDTIKHHLYVCPANSAALERHILSRNFLRKHEWARMQYQQMKYEAAEKAHQNSKVYAALKELTVNDFIDAIIAAEKKGQVIHYSNLTL